MTNRPGTPSAGVRRAKANGPVTEAELVARELAGRDFDCPRCRYPLRGLPGNICPECGFEITRSRLRFGVAHWRRPAFFVGGAGLIVAVIPAVAAAVTVIRAGMVTGRLDGADQFNMFILFVWVATLGKLGITWVNWSGTMAAWARWRHWLAAGACWTLPFIGAFIAWMMGVFA